MKHRKDLYREIGVSVVIFGILYLFYRSFWVLTLLLPCIMVYHRLFKKARDKKYKELLGRQFKDLLDSLAASLRAGYSMENALKECLAELNLVHGEGSPICLELVKMLNQIRLGVSLEEVFHDFALRSAQEDIETFASVYSIVRRTGGDLVKILQKTADDVAEKWDTRNEIQVSVSAKKLEMKVISIIPAGIILYIELTGEGLLDPLYGNLRGVLIMTVCLILYAAAVYWGYRIMDIEI